MKLILTDCDGVLLWWENHFHTWMQNMGHTQIRHGIYEIHDMYTMGQDEAKKLVQDFNDSSWIGFCPAFRDARSGVAKLVENGYQFACITSVGNGRFVHELRQKNLDDVFGKDVFSELVCLDPHLSKQVALEKYRNSDLWWIEDHPKNALLGLEMGLKPIVMDHSYNRDLPNTGMHRVNNWDDIVKLILSNE